MKVITRKGALMYTSGTEQQKGWTVIIRKSTAIF